MKALEAIMDKRDILYKVIKVSATEKPNKCVIYLPGEKEFSDFIRMDSLNYDIKSEIIKTVKDIFNINENQIMDIDKDNSSISFKGKNRNSSTSEKTRLIIFDDSVEIGSYTGKFYDYCVLRKNNEQ
jgi:archaellum biogenesis ATPase FlaH